MRADACVVEAFDALVASGPPPTASQREKGWSRDWGAFKAPPEAGAPFETYDFTGGERVRAARRRLHAAESAVPSVTLRTGGSMPCVGLGTWKAGKGEVKASVAAALRSGYRHIDCAWIYQNEGEVGAALGEAFAEGVCRRGDVFLTGKLWNNAHSREGVRRQLTHSMELLGVSYVDLFMVHWPVAQDAAAAAPRDAFGTLAETWSAMEDFVDDGTVRALGVCNFSAPKLERLLAFARHKPAVLQVEGHPYMRQEALHDFARERGLVTVAYSPLGSGDRSASEFKKENEPKLLDDPVLLRVAEEAGKSPAQVLIRWAVQRGTVTIPKSSNAGRIKQNIDVFSWRLTPEHMAALNALSQYRYVCGGPWCGPGQGKAFESTSALWDDGTGL